MGGKFRRLPFHSYNASKIYDWQQREGELYYNPTGTLSNYSAVRFKKLQRIRDLVISQIKYKKDIVTYEKKDHWATTDEILKRGTGDCEDQSFVMYRRMKEAGFPRDKIGIINVKGHAFACYQFCLDDFYILDNGYLTHKVVKASSYFLKNEKVRPIVGFNVVNQWSYK